MNYDVAVFGTLRFKRGKYRAWQKLVVDSRTNRAIARTFPRREHLEPRTVADLFGELPSISGHGLFQADEEEGEIHVRGLLTNKVFEARCRQLAALFMCAADVGAEGDICFLGQEVFVGYGVSVGGGAALLVTLSEDEVQNASMDPELDVISGCFHVPDVPESAMESIPPPSSTQKPKTTLLAPPPAIPVLTNVPGRDTPEPRGVVPRETLAPSTFRSRR